MSEFIATFSCRPIGSIGLNSVKVRVRFSSVEERPKDETLRELAYKAALPHYETYENFHLQHVLAVTT